MSSYYPSFNYMGLNSFKDKNLMVVHFESGDDGEMDTFLGMDQIYTENPYGTKRLTYGAKYNNVAVIRISVMKASGQDFTVAETRDFLRWTTGARQNSYLDLVDGDDVVVSFLGHVTSVYQQKIDARTVGFIIEHTSVSPWAYSALQHISCSFGQSMSIDENEVLSKTGDALSVNSDGVLSNGNIAMFKINNDGTMYIDDVTELYIENPSDDLYSYVNMDVTFKNGNSDTISIKNKTIIQETDGNDGDTAIYNIVNGEIIKINAGQFITSDRQGRLFGNDFNFIWPKLMPGANNFAISGSGNGVVEFEYRYPIKIGDCAIDVSVYNDTLTCGDCPDVMDTVNPIFWSDILDTPTTIAGYGIKDAYTINEVDNKLVGIDPEIDADQLNKMLQETLI